MKPIIKLAYDKFHSLQRDLPMFLDSDDFDDYIRKGYSEQQAGQILYLVRTNPWLTQTEQSIGEDQDD